MMKIHRLLPINRRQLALFSLTLAVVLSGQCYFPGVSQAGTRPGYAFVSAPGVPPAIPPEVVRAVNAAYCFASPDPSGLCENERADSIWQARELVAGLHRPAVTAETVVLHPRPPEEILFSGEGDCQDRVSLLLSLLARLGVTAYPVVSLRPDREPGPGLTLADFDHVLVNVSGENICWLDPTEPLSRSVGRWLLVCDGRVRWCHYGY